MSKVKVMTNNSFIVKVCKGRGQGQGQGHYQGKGEGQSHGQEQGQRRGVQVKAKVKDAKVKIKVKVKLSVWVNFTLLSVYPLSVHSTALPGYTPWWSPGTDTGGSWSLPGSR